MHGTPYWGENTFNDIRNIPELELEELTLEKISELCNDRGLLYDVKDIYTLFLSLAELDFLFLYGDSEAFLSWCRDIRFNYRDRYIFIPFYTYDTKTVVVDRKVVNQKFLDVVDDRTVHVRYNFSLKKTVVNNRKDNFSEKELYLYDYISKKKYHLALPTIPFIEKGVFSLNELSDRYINSAYFLEEGVTSEDWKKYFPVNNKKRWNKEYQFRKSLNLPLYKDSFIDIGYSDVRQYSYHELFEGVRLEEESEPFWLRIYKFEAYLYCIMAEGLDPIEEEYNSNFRQLGKTKRHITIQGVKPLILKHYYKDNVTMRRKSYERYN